MEGNYAEHDGGAVYLWDGSPRIESCTIRNNHAHSGAGVFIADAEPVLINCAFSGNSAVSGGGMYSCYFDWWPRPVLIQCRFTRNTAQLSGGGMFNARSDSYLVNCIFAGNSAEQGGGMANFDNTLASLVNCTFAENSASNGNALACESYNPVHPYPSDLQLTNCTLWDGGDEIWNKDGSTISISYSDVQGGFGGEGNIDSDPLFADPNNGDYHLKSQTGRWDPNPPLANWVKDDVTSPCIDAGDMSSPIGHEPFPDGGIVNMGAYGGTAEASKSYFGEPVCETIVAGDIDGDCKVDFKDFALMAVHWLEDNSGP
jgi:hypothetical protein